MKLQRVDPTKYQERSVPAFLSDAVRTLNELIAIDKKAVTEALGPGDYAFTDTSETYKKLEAHPSVIIGESLGHPVLSGLGILNGILMTPRFRLYIETEDDNYTFKLAGIMEDLDWLAQYEPILEGAIHEPK
jgi:hypothetical protein